MMCTNVLTYLFSDVSRLCTGLLVYITIVIFMANHNEFFNSKIKGSES